MKWLIIALIYLLPNLATAQGGMGPGPGTVHSIGGGGTVTVDGKTATANSATGTSVSTSAITISAGSNRALLVGVVMDSGSVLPVGLGCVYDVAGANQTMTAVSGTNTGISAAITAAMVFYGLVNPTSGASKTVTCSWTASSTVGVVAISFTGTNQSSVAAAFPNGNFNSPGSAASPAAVTITSATGHKTVAMEAQNCVPFGAISGTTLTAELDMANVGFVSNYDNGAATVAMTAAFSGTCAQLASGTDVSP